VWPRGEGDVVVWPRGEGDAGVAATRGRPRVRRIGGELRTTAVSAPLTMCRQARAIRLRVVAGIA